MSESCGFSEVLVEIDECWRTYSVGLMMQPLRSSGFSLCSCAVNSQAIKSKEPHEYPLFARCPLLAVARFHLSQQANVNLDLQPAEEHGESHPVQRAAELARVHDDRTVTFRLKAPAAKEVRLVGAAFSPRWAEPTSPCRSRRATTAFGR